jgi:hypothetical protein
MGKNTQALSSALSSACIATSREIASFNLNCLSSILLWVNHQNEKDVLQKWINLIIILYRINYRIQSPGKIRDCIFSCV